MLLSIVKCKNYENTYIVHFNVCDLFIHQHHQSKRFSARTTDIPHLDQQEPLSKALLPRKAPQNVLYALANA